MEKNTDLEIISHLKPSKIVKIMKDPEASAKAVHLVYTTDAETDGITRKKTGNTYSYYKDGKKIKEIRKKLPESKVWLFHLPGKMYGSVLLTMATFRQQALMSKKENNTATILFGAL
ncbi:hypothetical protein JOE44_004819 [Chryseobacterium sp. PvR013]|nr:hypothetical protein [Chryseobacterium sp. PvR013]MBP1167935.1 hypothetical protein [Chryseobacterium sp. PvR013]